MKIAFITSRFPYPVEKGDKLRAFHQLRWLGARHEVHLFAITHQQIDQENISVLEDLCKSVNVYPISASRLLFNVGLGWLDGLPAQVAYFLDPRLRRAIQRDLIRLNPDHIYCQLIRASEYVRILPVAKTLDYMDVFSVGASQRAQTGNWLLRPFFAEEARRLRRYERSVYGDFTHHSIISTQDRDRLPLSYNGNVAVVSNGVDHEYFSPSRPSSSEFDILFVGNMGYLPNIEAAEYLVKSIMPLVWKQHPEAVVCLAGARPHRRVRRLGTARVHVTGWVEDIRPYYDRARIFVAPMFTGLGQQNKILEAMAMEVPCITTPIVDRAIGASGVGALVVAEEAVTFASTIDHLMSAPEEAAVLGKKGRACVIDRYDWEAQNKHLEGLLTKGRITIESETMHV